MSDKFEINPGESLVVTKEMYEKFEEAIIKKAIEKAVPLECGKLEGIKIYVQSYLPKDTILVVGKDPDFPGAMKIMKIIKLVNDEPHV